MPMIEASENVIKKESIELSEILERNPQAKEAYVEFEAECKLRKDLAVARKKMGMTQKELQEKTGLTQQVISRMEKDYEISPSIKNLIKYVEAIGYELTIQPKR